MVIIIIFWGDFQKYMRAGDQKHIILLEWPNIIIKYRISSNLATVRFYFKAPFDAATIRGGHLYTELEIGTHIKPIFCMHA